MVVINKALTPNFFIGCFCYSGFLFSLRYTNDMPELPEVETSRRGIEPHILNNKIDTIIIRYPTLRWPIPKDLAKRFTGKTITAVKRRGKFLLLHTKVGTMMLHLGMSGVLRIVDHTTPVKKHDHVDIQFADGVYLRFNDPRRFGCLLYTADDPLQHRLLAKLAPEPLSEDFDSEYLFNKSRKKKIALKLFIMNNHHVVGVGNIYANEALFKAGLLPTRPTESLTKPEATKLVRVIKKVLQKAITAGGTTLKDFSQVDGRPGYFAQKLLVYGKDGMPCPECGMMLQGIKLGGRMTVFCEGCQE
jgi:formamidopyrimidine-DNA glycosylase